MGALIIEDRADIHAIPDQIANMPEMVLTIQVTVSTCTTKTQPIRSSCDSPRSLELLSGVSLVTCVCMYVCMYAV